MEQILKLNEEELKIKLNYPLAYTKPKNQPQATPQTNKTNTTAYISLLKFKAVDDQLDRLISWAGRRFLFAVKQANHKFAYLDLDDVRQEMKMWIWDVCVKYSNKPETELIKIGKTMIWRWVLWHIRKAQFKKNQGKSILLSNFENPDEVMDNLAWKHNESKVDKSMILSIDLEFMREQFNAFLEHSNLVDAVDVHIYHLIAYPDQEPAFIVFCQNYNAGKKRKRKNIISQTNIAHYLGLNNYIFYNRLHHLKVVYQQFKHQFGV